jgi:YkoY family integral membrane protein
MSFQLSDLGTIALLVFLEGVLSIDNAVVLALLAARLPKHQQKKALSYGLIGAIAFRTGSLFIANQLMRWTWVKFLGGGYLLYLGGKYWLTPERSRHAKMKDRTEMGLWKTVVLIELMDLAFAIDSILAAVAISRTLWVIITGGLIGMILMRYAATFFIKFLEKFPAFEDSAYLLILLVGFKLCLEGFHLEAVDFHSRNNWAFWFFWGGMLLSVLYGFRKKKRPQRKHV